MAKGFKEHNKISGSITAWDGGTVFDYSKEDNVRGAGKNHFWQTWKSEKQHQSTWWKWVKKDKSGNPVRKRQGKIIITGS